MQRYRLGVDIGGTFTDFALLDESTGRITALKFPSNKERPAASIFGGIRDLAARYDVSPAELVYFTHGTTLGVNTLLQYNGAKSALLVTAGLRDILYIGRHRVPDIFNFFTEMPKPLIPRSQVVEINERSLSNGSIAHSVDESEIVRKVQKLVDNGVEAIAVGFLHSYRNPANELAVKGILNKHFPQVFVSLSSQIWPQMREYERILICVMNAYVGRKMEAYFDDLEAGLRDISVSAPILSTKSNGGLMTAAEAARRPVETLMSGPAAGAIGAAFVAQAAGFDKLITFDMGGTSTDVSIIEGHPRFSAENQIGDFPVIMPAIDVTSIGAGGGSIAWLDSSLMLKVGPESAGARPGPACYGLGGERPTLTDAFVCLGVIQSGPIAGGKVTIDLKRARDAMQTLAEPLSLSIEETAESVLRIATSQIFAVLVPLLARKGIDYSDFALLPFGGGGPMHGFLAAKEVGIRRVLVPLHPGILCATGALVADVRRDFVRTLHGTLRPEDARGVMGVIRDAFAELQEEGNAWLSGQNLQYVERRMVKTLDMRYLGQSFEISIMVDHAILADDTGEALRSVFHDEYKKIYGRADNAGVLEVRDVRVGAIGVTSKPKIEAVSTSTANGEFAAFERKQIYHEGHWQDAVFIERSQIRADTELRGPAIIKQYDTTTFVPSGYSISIDQYGNLIGEAV